MGVSSCAASCASFFFEAEGAHHHGEVQEPHGMESSGLKLTAQLSRFGTRTSGATLLTGFSRRRWGMGGGAQANNQSYKAHRNGAC